MSHTPDDASADFGPEITLLSDSHPPLEPHELDRVKTRVRGRTRRPRSGRSGSFARSRGAIVAAIAAGTLMTTGATALGVSGLASNGSASIAQYTPAGGGGALPDSGSGGGGGALPSSGSDQGVAPAQQVAQAGPSTNGTLPFTGFALIPVLLIGLALLATGLVARRRAGRGAHATHWR